MKTKAHSKTVFSNNQSQSHRSLTRKWKKNQNISAKEMNSFCSYPEQLKLLLVSLSFCKTLKACFLRHFKIISNKLVTQKISMEKIKKCISHRKTNTKLLASYTIFSIFLTLLTVKLVTLQKHCSEENLFKNIKKSIQKREIFKK